MRCSDSAVEVSGGSHSPSCYHGDMSSVVHIVYWLRGWHFKYQHVAVQRRHKVGKLSFRSWHDTVTYYH